MKHVIMSARIKLGPDLSELEWHELLADYRSANIAKLRAINRGDLVVSEKQRADIERCARGVWDFYDA